MGVPCAARFSKSWPYFRPKNVIFHTRFQTRPLKSMPVFRQKLCHPYLASCLRAQTKNSSNPFRIRTFLSHSYSSGIETIDNSIHSRSSLENHTWFQTKLGKVYSLFPGEGGGGGVLPYKRLMGMCRSMASHFHDWSDYNGVAFSIDLLEWGRKFSDFWGK